MLRCPMPIRVPGSIIVGSNGASGRSAPDDWRTDPFADPRSLTSTCQPTKDIRRCSRDTVPFGSLMPQWPGSPVDHVAVERRLPSEHVVHVERDPRPVVEHQHAERRARAPLDAPRRLVQADPALPAGPRARVVEVVPGAEHPVHQDGPRIVARGLSCLRAGLRRPGRRDAGGGVSAVGGCQPARPADGCRANQSSELTVAPESGMRARASRAAASSRGWSARLPA